MWFLSVQHKALLVRPTGIYQKDCRTLEPVLKTASTTLLSQGGKTLSYLTHNLLEEDQLQPEEPEERQGSQG